MAVVALGWSLAATPPGIAAMTPALVEAMLANAPNGAESRCSYTRIKVDGDGSKRERFHAVGDQAGWVLERVDGRAPSEAELRRYASRAEARDRRHPLAFDLREMVDPAHWRLLSETSARATFEFRLRPNDELDAALVDKVVGTLVVDKARVQPERISIANTAPAYVAPLVRVAEYAQEMRFDWDSAVGAAVLTQAETHLRGRALGIRALRQHKLVLYTDYRCQPELPARAGAVAPAAASRD